MNTSRQIPNVTRSMATALTTPLPSPAPPPPLVTVGEYAACGCPCECGQASPMLASAVTALSAESGTSISAARSLRCEPCIRPQHLATQGGWLSQTARQPVQITMPNIPSEAEVEADRQAAAAMEVIWAEQRRTAALARARRANAGVDWGRFEAADINLPPTPDHEKDYAACRRWMDSGHRELLLAGPVGRGKTGASYAIAKTVMEATPSTVLCLIQWEHLLRAWEDDSWAGKTRAEELTSRATTADLLIIQDAFRMKPTQNGAAELAALLDARSSITSARTIITTNAGVPGSAGAAILVNKDPAVYARLYSRLSAFRWVEMTAGPDLRAAQGGPM